jgi:hypothetical protein
VVEPNTPNNTLDDLLGLRSDLIDQLQKRSAEHFLPTIKRLNQLTDEKKEVRFHCLRDYCFVRLAWEDRLSVLQS